MIAMGVRSYKLLTRSLARGLRTPQYIILFLSDHCWMQCRHCWFNEEWKSENLGTDALTYDELERLAGSIDRLGFLSITGGEAFARRDLTAIVAMFARTTRLGRYQIPTSGFKTDLILEKTERMLSENPMIPFRVDVSLDGTEEVHDRIRNRPGSFAHACETIRSLHCLKRRYAHFDVGVITTISNHNQHQIAELGRVIEDIHSTSEWMINITRGTVRDPVCKDVDPENYLEAHRIVEDRITSGRQRGHAGHRSAAWLSAKNAARRKIILETLRGSYRGGGCAAGALACVIYSDGDVFPCELLDRPLGNVRDFDYDLKALWRSPAAQEARSWIQDTRCHCTQECFLSTSMLIQPRCWPDIVRERLRLALPSTPIAYVRSSRART
jgi:radical SAM protein with 4Fe4S-binding SPASM domain